MPDAKTDRRRFPRRQKNLGPPAEERRYCDDRRHDIDSRERVEWLEMRYRRITELLYASLAVTLVCTTIGFIWLGGQSRHLSQEQAQREADTRARISESCRLSEAAQAKAVDQLQQTYDFLEHPPSSLKSLAFYVRANLSKTEADARQQAPSYCDAPGVGLPEPRTKVKGKIKVLPGGVPVPPRPADLR